MAALSRCSKVCTDAKAARPDKQYGFTVLRVEENLHRSTTQTTFKGAVLCMCCSRFGAASWEPRAYTRPRQGTTPDMHLVLLLLLLLLVRVPEAVAAAGGWVGGWWWRRSSRRTRRRLCRDL